MPIIQTPRFLFAIFVLVFGVTISCSASANVPLYSGKSLASIVYDEDSPKPIVLAAKLLASDLTKLSGTKPQFSGDLSKSGAVTVLIGEAKSPVVSKVLKANHIDAAQLVGKWESYGRVAVQDPADSKRTILVIFGSDVRGTIWGVIDLSREMGVSAWEWWADVNVRRVSQILVDGSLRYSKEPTVKYRGIFLNDEDWGLQPWAAKTYDLKARDIGPKAYARIFELMWRLKANIIWPAMHDVTKPFNRIPGNAEMAASYAIIRGTSHAEPMLRNNVGEWDGKTMGAFNYRTNRENMLSYWAASLEKYKNFENIFTIGLRGIHDSPMEGASSPLAAMQLEQQVLSDQRTLLQSRLGQPIDQIPQVLIPYKEVLEVYDAGLAVPEDVTLVWPDDNHGYIRRLSNSLERKRSGGSGVYYHISYWGAPMSYLWLATTHPALIWEEMDKAYRYDARRMWILNVGDIKPGEYLTQLFLDMAFDDGEFADINSAHAHLVRWMQSIFGEAHGAKIAQIMWRYYDLSFVRRPEFMGWNESYPNSVVHQTEFNMTSFGDENARRLRDYQGLVTEVKNLAPKIPVDRRDAFFELVQYPVEGAAAINARFLNTDKAIAFGQQHRYSANQYADQAKSAELRIRQITDFYNVRVAGGKWRHMMNAAPQGIEQFRPQMRLTWKPERSNECGLVAEGGSLVDLRIERATLPVYYSDIPRSHFIDIFSRGSGTLQWFAKADQPWIKVSKTRGTLTAKMSESRLSVSVDWSVAPKRGRGLISVVCGKERLPLEVSVALDELGGNEPFAEENRIVSIPATKFETQSSGWDVLPGLGRTGASVRSNFKTPSIELTNAVAVKSAPRLTYRFATKTMSDLASIKLTFLPFSPITSENGMRVAIGIDDQPLVEKDISAGEYSERWRRNVLNNTAEAIVPDVKLEKGSHTLTVVALDPGVTMENVEISFEGAPKAYGPVPETRVR